MSSDQRRAASISVVPRDVAILVPCYDEQGAIAKVVADFRAPLPDAALYVYDNNSTDGTVAVAEKAGAAVRHETYQGRGHVVRRMFNAVEAAVSALFAGEPPS